MWNWYAGVDDFVGFMRRVFRTRGTDWRTEPLWANGEAGYAAYTAGTLHTVQILTVAGGPRKRLTAYHDDALRSLPYARVDAR